MPNPNQYLLNPQWGGRNLANASQVFNNVPIPASGIELTMHWLDRIAEQHDWVNRYSGHELINPSGFNWKRHNGLELEDFVPNSGKPYRLEGYPTSATTFWEHFRKVIKFVGEKTLRYYDLYGGTASGSYSTTNESGWNWEGLNAKWFPYGQYINDQMTLTTSGIVQYGDSSHTKYMGIPGKLAYEDYLQYVPPMNRTAKFDSFAFSAVKASSIQDSHFCYLEFILPSSFYSDGIFIFDVNNNNAPPSSIVEIPLVGCANSGYSEWIGNSSSVTPFHNYYRLWDTRITTANRYYTQPEFNILLSSLNSGLLPVNSGWTYDSDILPVHSQFLKYSKGELQEKVFDISLALTFAERFTLSASLDYRFPIVCLYNSRHVQSSISGDQNFGDYNHYLRSFTGFTPNDQLNIASDTIDYASNLHVSGEYRFYFQDYPYGIPFFDDPWECSGVYYSDINITNNGNFKFIYGWTDYNPYEASGYMYGIPFTPTHNFSLDNSPGVLRSSNAFLYYRRYLGNKIINQIFNNEYSIIGEYVSNSGSLEFTTFPEFSTDFHLFNEDRGDSHRNMNLGSVSGIVDLTPSGNILWFSILPGGINSSSTILNNSTMPEYYIPAFNNQSPYAPSRDEAYYKSTQTDIVRSRAQFTDGGTTLNNRTNQEKTSYFSVNSGSVTPGSTSISYPDLNWSNFGIIQNNPIYNTN